MTANKAPIAKEKANVKAPERQQTKSDSVPEKRGTNKENEKPIINNKSDVKNSASSLTHSVDVGAPEREYFIRCVVLGSKNAGKYSLINANLPGSTKPQQKNDVDLVMKQKVSFKTTRKYHFWVQTLGETSEMKEALWKTYYKWATAFVFVYDITNKESFEALEKAVQSVLKVVPREKFFGILVANKSDLQHEAVVDQNTANEFKEKYNLSHFVETNSSNESENALLLSKLDRKMKLTFEAI